MLGRRVWADEEVQSLARNFLCIADEVWTLDHIDSPGSKFFKEYASKASVELRWGASTKQGVYAPRQVDQAACGAPPSAFLGERGRERLKLVGSARS